MVVIPQNRDRSKEMNIDSIQVNTFRGKLNTASSPMEINLESTIVQVYSKKGPNLKRRKVNLFKDYGKEESP